MRKGLPQHSPLFLKKGEGFSSRTIPQKCQDALRSERLQQKVPPRYNPLQKGLCMPGQHIVGPTSHYYYSQRLKLQPKLPRLVLSGGIVFRFNQLPLANS